MGFGLPAAIGAKVACPDKIVIDVDGDASLTMTAVELVLFFAFLPLPLHHSSICRLQLYNTTLV